MEAITNYVGINYDPHVLQFIEEMEDITPEEPELVTPTEPNKVRGEEIKYGKKLDRHLSKIDKIETQMKQVFSIFMRQMDDDIKHRLAKHKEWEGTKQQKYLIKMLEILQGINFSHTSTQEPIVTMWESITDFAKIRQGKYQSVPEYYKRFCAIRDVNNSLGCSIYSHTGLIKVIACEKGENASTISTAKNNTYMKIGKDRMMAMHFLMGSDKIKYDDTITSYKNMYLMNKRNNYPATLHNA